jgi:hypothetical protein
MEILGQRRAAIEARRVVCKHVGDQDQRQAEREEVVMRVLCGLNCHVAG